MQIQALHLKNFIDYARVRGVQEELMTCQIKTPLPDLSNEIAVVNEEDFYAVLSVIDKTLKDDLWGINAGNFLGLKLLGLIYKISLQATTIQEAFHYLQSYLLATYPIVRNESTVSDDLATVILDIDNEHKTINRKIIEMH